MTKPPTPAPRFGPDTPALGAPLEIEPGIWWLRFPLPFALDHVNLWALDDGDGWTLIDTGFGNEATRDLWLALLDGFLATKPVHRLVVTHFHPDHVGQAGWLAARTGAEVWMPQTEWLTARLLFLDDGADALATAMQFYRQAGLEPSMLDAMGREGNVYPRRIVAPPRAFRPLVDGARLVMGQRSWAVRMGRGHAPEQATFWCEAEALWIAADQVLPRISPNVAVWPGADRADPLALFLDSCRTFQALPATTRVLPSHDWPFVDLPSRIEALVRHHDERLDQCLDALRSGGTATAALRRLFPKVTDTHQLRFALGETLAHLNRLVALGRLARIDDGDVWHFVEAG
ncbi:MAG: MBL fold metallo-hydrolase [Pseudomonadota bacterium]